MGKTTGRRAQIIGLSIAAAAALLGCAPPDDKPPILGGGGSQSDAGTSILEAPPLPTDDGSSATLACTGEGPVVLDAALPLTDYGRVYMAAFRNVPGVGSPTFAVVNHRQSDGRMHAQIYAFDAAAPTKVTKGPSLAAQVVDLKLDGASFVLLAIDGNSSLHALRFAAAPASSFGAGTAPVDTALGPIAACDLLTGTLHVNAPNDYLAAVSGTACGTGKAWLGVSRSGKTVKSIAVHEELMPSNPQYPLDAMIMLNDAIVVNGSEFSVFAGPNYKGFTALGGMSTLVYPLDLGTFSEGTPRKLAIGTPNDMLWPIAFAKGPNVAVKAVTPANGTPVPPVYIASGSTAASAVAGQGLAQQTFASTPFASVDDALMWNVTANWWGDQLLATSVRLGTPSARGANLYWWRANGTLRAGTSAANALGKTTAFKSVAASFKNPLAPSASLWLTGLFPGASGTGTVVTYDVTCK